MNDCLFCGIIAGTVPAQIVLADDVAVAFLDARPVFKGHLLVAPREHYVTLPDLPVRPGRPAVSPGAAAERGRPGRARRPGHASSR